MASALRLTGPLDLAALLSTPNAIVARHEILRTRFVERAGEPVQIVDPELHIEVPLDDLSGLSGEACRDRVTTALRREHEQLFDLARGPLLRVKLLCLHEQDHILVRTMHHIVSDGWSQAVFQREFAVLYEAYRNGGSNPLPPLALQYADFVLWQQQALNETALRDGLSYWKQQLAGIPARLELPVDRPRYQLQTFRARAYEFLVPAPKAAAVKELSQGGNATLFMTLLSAFGALLAGYSGQDDLVVGTPVADRQAVELEPLIGFFVNMLALRMRVQPEMSFRELLSQVRRTALEAYQHQDAPFERLVEALAPRRFVHNTPVFQVVFAWDSEPSEAPSIPGLQIALVEGGERRARFDLEVHARETRKGVRLTWIYNSDLFDDWRIEQMARHYLRVIEAAVAYPDQALGSIDYLTDEEQQSIAAWSGGTSVNINVDF